MLQLLYVQLFRFSLQFAGNFYHLTFLGVNKPITFEPVPSTLTTRLSEQGFLLITLYKDTVFYIGLGSAFHVRQTLTWPRI